MNVAVAAHPTLEQRVARGLAALDILAKERGWTRAQKRRARWAFLSIVNPAQAEAEAAGR